MSQTKRRLLAILGAGVVLLGLIGFASQRADKKTKMLRQFCEAIAVGSDVNKLDDAAKQAGFQPAPVPLASAQPGERETLVWDSVGTTSRACVVRHIDGKIVTAKVVNTDD